MNSKITVLVPASELPAEGADAPVLAGGQEPAPSDLLTAYSDLLTESAVTFNVSADGAVDLGDDPGAPEDLLALDVSGEAGAEASFAIESESPRTSVDLAAVATSVTGTFDAEDGMRQLVANLASDLRTSLGEDGRSPVPLVRWHQSASETDEDSGGVAQLLGVWLAGDEQLEVLRASGSEGIIFDESEVEGRGLREGLTAIAVLGVMVAGTASADAGLFFNRKAKKQAAVTQTTVTQTASHNRQAPVKIDRSALSNTSASETMVIVDVSKQRAYILAGGKIVVDTPVSTARSGKHTPRGEFNITQRVKTGKTSTIYGCELPYWMRLDQSAIGMHIGDLPGYPASAGCIRLPSNVAPIMFELTKSGTTVKVVDSWQPTSTMVASR